MSDTKVAENKRRMVQIDVNDDEWKQLRHLVIDKSTSLGKFVTEAVRRELKRG